MQVSSTPRLFALRLLGLSGVVGVGSLGGCSRGGQGFDDGSDELGRSVGAEVLDAGSRAEVPEQDAIDAAAEGLPVDAAEDLPQDDVSASPVAEPGAGGGTVGTMEPVPAGGETGTPSGAVSGAGGGTPDGVTPSDVGALPCDVFEGDGLPCVSAHSTVRLVVSRYAGPIYQVQRQDGMTLDVGTVDGYADAAAQDAFCSDGSCVIKILYDQSGMGNDLTEAPPGSAKPTPGQPVNAEDLPVTINGRSAYGMRFRPGMGYRKLVGNGTARGDEPETIYMVTSQHDLINGCCFDYGNAETSANNDGNGTAEAVYFGHGVIWGSGVDEGPWVMADLENGLYPGWENGQEHGISTNTPLQYDFVTAVLVGDTAEKNDGRGRFALYGADATNGTLKTMYDGIRPEKPGYVPMQKQGSVILGIAGDNSDGDGGRFYEGVMANGAASMEALDALQAAIVGAAYGE